MIELYRCIVPTSKVINDNAGQHYRTHMGKLEWLTHQFNTFFMNGEKGPGNFSMPSVEEITNKLKEKSVNEKIQDRMINIRCEVWRCKNTTFDPQNYAKTFKAPIDLLVHNGYFEDDSWKYVNGITYCGGGRDVWSHRPIRYSNDGLPEELTPDWWKEYSSDYNDIMIRILIE